MATTQHQLGCGLHLPSRAKVHRTRYAPAHRLLIRAHFQEACRKSSAAAVPVLLAVTLPEPSSAITADQIVGAFNKAQEFTGQVVTTVGSIYQAAAGLVQQTYAFVKPAVDLTLPAVQKTSDAAFKAAAPVASDVASKAVQALQSAGVDTKPVVEAGQTAVTVAGGATEQATTLLERVKPVITSTFDSLFTTDPLVLAGEAGALVLLYFLAPGIASSIGTAARGYKGDLTAPQALDFVSNKNYVLIDVRSEKEKSRSGVPSLPNKAKKNFISIPIEEFPSKIRSQLRNARGVEAEVAAIKISSLKRVDKGTNIVVLDSVGNVAKVVAKCLDGLGFKKTWTVIDGFDGSRGWVQNRLGKDSYNTSYAEVMSPARIIPAATNSIFKTSSSNNVVDVPPRSKLLPSGD